MSIPKQFMPHTNATLGIVTFEANKEDPFQLDTTIHYIIGWLVNETARPIPVSALCPPKWFADRQFYTIYLPEGIIVDPVGAGTSMTLEEAMTHFQLELVTKEKEENPPPAYNH